MRFAWEVACSEAAGMRRTPEKSSLSCVGSGLSFLSWELVLPQLLQDGTPWAGLSTDSAQM